MKNAQIIPVFVGSSGSDNARAVAEKIVETITASKAHSAFEAWPWWKPKMFPTGKTIIECIEVLSERVHFAIFVIHPDDFENSTLKLNALFEAGFFMGSHGRRRTFLVCHRSLQKQLSLSDKDGLVVLPFSERTRAGIPRDRDFKLSLSKLLGELQERSPRSGAVSGGGLLGLPRKVADLERFETRESALTAMIEDIAAAKRKLTLVARVYPSELLRSPGLADAVAKAVRSQKASSRFLVELHQTNPFSEDSVKAAYAIERKSKPTLDSFEKYRTHLDLSPVKALIQLADRVAVMLKLEIGERGESKLRLEMRRHFFLNGFLPSVSMVSIDDRVIFVSFYRVGTRDVIGTYAPTFRLEDRKGQDTEAFRLVLEELGVLVGGSCLGAACAQSILSPRG